MFEASRPEVEQARGFGVTLAPGQDTSGHVRDALAPFGVPVVLHKGDFTQAPGTAGRSGSSSTTARNGPGRSIGRCWPSARTGSRAPPCWR